MKTTHLKNYIELAARWYVFIILTIYGTGKLLGGQFYIKGNLPKDIAIQTLDSVNSFDLAWTFMGHSYVYILFIGMSQLLGAFCLLFNKTKLLGVVILIPILVNIIVFDAIFFETYGALGSASIYLLLLLLILYINKETVLKLIKNLMNPRVITEGFSNNLYLKVGIVILIVSLFFGFDQLVVNLLGH